MCEDQGLCKASLIALVLLFASKEFEANMGAVVMAVRWRFRVLACLHISAPSVLIAMLPLRVRRLASGRRAAWAIDADAASLWGGGVDGAWKRMVRAIGLICGVCLCVCVWP